VDPHVVERVLNHVSGTFGGVAGVYNRFTYLNEVREALTVWEAHVRQLCPNVCTEAIIEDRKVPTLISPLPTA
jgi:hypothetical protein